MHYPCLNQSFTPANMPRSTVKLPQTVSTAQQAPASGYLPSVPISVYRQLAAELHATQAQLDAVQQSNQHLMGQNQQLRQEAQKVLKAAHKMQQVLNTIRPASDNGVNLSQRMTEVEKILRQTPTPTNQQPIAPAPPQQLPPSPEPTPPKKKLKKKKLVAEVRADYRHQQATETNNSEVNGWLLALSILLIVVMAFGTGFLVMRPLLKSISNGNS